MRAKDFVREAKKHISPSGAETTMDPQDDDYEINYGPDGGVAKFRKAQGLDVRTGSKKVTKGVTEGSEEQVYKVVALDKSDALKKPTKLNVKASSIEDVFSRLAANDWYALSINGVEVIGGKRLKPSVAEGSNDTNEYYADYYTDLLSQVRNMSWTDRATTRDKVKRDLDSGRIKLADLKMEIRDLDREIIGKQGVAEGQVTERSQDPNQRSEAADQLFKMFMKIRERDFAGITPEDIKKMKQLVNVSGRGYEFWVSGTGYRNAGWMLDLAVQEYREAQARSGVMPEFTGRASTARDMAQQIAQQTRGRYDYNFPRTWTTGYGRRYRDPEDYVVYPDRESYEDAWQWIEQKGQKVHYYDSFRTLQTAVKIGRYVLEPASITRGAFSDQPETTHQISVRSAASLNQGVRTRADITDQQAAALHDIAATRSTNAMAGIRAIMDVLQGEEDLKRVIDSSKKIDPRDKAKLDAIIAAAGKTR